MAQYILVQEDLVDGHKDAYGPFDTIEEGREFANKVERENAENSGEDVETWDKSKLVFETQFDDAWYFIDFHAKRY